ncbi:DeoR/GlpR family DNA-binding transcription regulator [Sporosarcina ureilytica]|uniref:DeoR family transcriptional regulator n=1 Tax=Sporosarcina ureilytica TaxID=298596 RepID=A0A1D8JJ14_9BACL|nr:DeoR/GlpR family DNA-binding transcription regulator [Sporosarcina ureilytica]AOV08697.1 DeoR family transcriptional regulator [Sporosarcina ureilytica]
MLTNERQQVILDLLAEKQTIKIQEIIELTNASESTIRRDLTELENEHKLARIHGGATIRGRKLHEPSMLDKTAKNLQEKQRIAELAASFIQEGDCIFLDAGTTTFQMIPHLRNKKVVVVTNGLTHVEALIEHGVTTYLAGGYVKGKTRALVGPQTIQSLQNYRFDKCFLGVNGFDATFGYTTPDPEEAAVKRQASACAKHTYVVADHTKYGEVSFSSIDTLSKATLITSKLPEETLRLLRENTTFEVVSA